MFELERAKPEEGGIELQGVLNFMEQFEKMDGHSFVIIHHGRVVAEAWRKPYCQEYLHSLYSGTKCFTALAVGFAYDEGLLRLDDHVVDFFQKN